MTLWGILYGVMLVYLYLVQEAACGCECRCRVCHIEGKKLQVDVRSIYQSVTMLWFFTPYSTVNQVFPILTTQCTGEGIHPSSLTAETITAKQYVLELSSSNYDPVVSGSHVKLLLNVIKKESKNFVRKISFRVCGNL